MLLTGKQERFFGEQMVTFLKRVEVGVRVAEIRKQARIS
jgi:hypothetical protein